jgi:hypothetical protein
MRRARHKAQRDVREHSSSEEILRKRFSLVSLHLVTMHFGFTLLRSFFLLKGKGFSYGRIWFEELNEQLEEDYDARTLAQEYICEEPKFELIREGYCTMKSKDLKELADADDVEALYEYGGRCMLAGLFDTPEVNFRRRVTLVLAENVAK